MTRTMTLMTIAALSLVATPVVVNATSTPRPAQTVAVTPAPIVVATATPADQPACTRKVRVVYAGLGEGAQGCATPVAQR